MSFQVSDISRNKVRILAQMALRSVEPTFHSFNWHFGCLQRSNGEGSDRYTLWLNMEELDNDAAMSLNGFASVAEDVSLLLRR